MPFFDLRQLMNMPLWLLNTFRSKPARETNDILFVLFKLMWKGQYSSMDLLCSFFSGDAHLTPCEKEI
ncbi:MAG: hypothetical protein COV07_03770 [Candidatus Vogelbacteria bacterium CG10_big_fil_rev_8_21_14_0_10_45_14]|uniref:Uncharacterized protein n=1 Tax=Candidatus Vogelbacteria bacterium CG10_big_fil_rev_8_21_14_0_10_45_14 TaxID=1975042 RepID=A0A2H0RJ80_9BACT|nr:MAG: hypothetical protein COV07_03770 [Candidatus Vogelbacteria bacterium CG10_big_fil_rev_8_21_14_0_10_45_14]